ncbi:hypothetical protein JCM10449v2_005207 [Rhodotorula kratochvilovae]
MPQTRCSVCDSHNSRRCGSCAAAGFDIFFCSPEHQKLVWKTHREVCGARSSPFMPPGLSPEEDAKLRKTAFNEGWYVTLTDENDVLAARTVWATMYGAAGLRLPAGQASHPPPRLRLAVPPLPLPDKLRAPNLTPFHSTAAVLHPIRAFPGFDPAEQNRFLHTLLVLFTLLMLEARPDGPPEGYDPAFVEVALRNVFEAIRDAGALGDVGRALDTLNERTKTVAGISSVFVPEEEGGAIQVTREPLGP